MSPRNSPGRRAAATVLTVVYILALPAAITGAWIRGTVLSTSGYVAAVAPLAADPGVRATVRAVIDGEVSLVVSHAIKSTAPSPVSILAGPVSSGLGSLAGNGTGALLASPEFQQLWTAANTAAHSQIVSVLNGNSTAVATAGDEVVLNLAPLITAALKDISGPLSGLTGKTITPPAISALPAAACGQIASLAHAQLPTECGQIPLFPASALARARLAFRLLSAGTLTLVILPPRPGPPRYWRPAPPPRPAADVYRGRPRGPGGVDRGNPAAIHPHRPGTAALPAGHRRHPPRAHRRFLHPCPMVHDRQPHPGRRRATEPPALLGRCGQGQNPPGRRAATSETPPNPPLTQLKANLLTSASRPSKLASPASITAFPAMPLSLARSA